MADNEDQARPEGQAPPKKSSRTKLAMLIGGLMSLEAVGVFVVIKFFWSGPDSADAADAAEGEAADAGEHGGGGGGEEGGQEGGHSRDAALPGASHLDAEVGICELNAFNKRDGQLYLYQIKVTALVPGDRQAEADQLVKARQATIDDRMNTLIRGADPQHLNEPGLETLRRQIKFELGQVFQDEKLIREILIPKLLQTRSGL